jgi:hypothetical protein
MNQQNFTDAPWFGGMYRMHHFWSTAPPVKGLAVDILPSRFRTFAFVRLTN